MFLAKIGITNDMSGLNAELLGFTAILLIMAVLSKVIGCGLGAKVCGLTSKESLNVGIGMVSRGEVAFMAAQKGMNAGLVNPAVFPAVVIAVVGATLLTPIMLKASMAEKAIKPAETTV